MRQQKASLIYVILILFLVNRSNQSRSLYLFTQAMEDDYDYPESDGQNYNQYNYPDEEEPAYPQENHIVDCNETYQNKKQSYEILPLIRIYEQLQLILKEIQTIICLDLGWCLLLLNEFKWEKEYLKQEYYNHSQDYLCKIGFIPNSTFPTNQNWKSGNCEVCLSEDVPIFKNFCNHQYCLYCWFSHIKSCLQSGSSFPRCMDGSCGRPILFETVLKLLRSEGHSGAVQLKTYERKLCELFITTNENYRFCIGVDCGNCIKRNLTTLQTVACVCGKVFCFRCQSDDHYPCKCEQKKKWVAQVLTEEANAKWIVNNAKICPFCKKAVERSMGCNFMACRCGKSFCYMCSQPWQPNHSDHFKCHIYKQKLKDQISQERELLQRLNHSTERFVFNQSVANNYRDIDVFAKRKQLFKILKVELTESEFLDNAFKFAIECCEKLKWIYAFTYFHDMKGTDMKDIFEYSLGEYQRYKQNLLKLLAVDLKKFMEAVEGYEIGNTDDSVFVQSLLNDFGSLKKHIVTLYTCTKNYKQKFVQELNNITEVLSKQADYKYKIKQQAEQAEHRQQKNLNMQILHKVRQLEEKQRKDLKGQVIMKEEERKPEKTKKGFWSLFGRGKEK